MKVIVNRTAGGAIGANRFVKHGATAGEVVVATAGVQCGVCVQPGGVASGERVDVQLLGLVQIIAGGTIAAGGPITSDGAGAAVAAAPATGVNALVFGFAHEAAVAGDIFWALPSPHTMQGA